ncbi:glycosyltransferase [Hydrogenophaga sp.]|uniref:glycosyltransferase n=1 Tax=Hydrogenophaga sp. TaxID=1904254 RepID=UPI003AF5FECC
MSEIKATSAPAVTVIALCFNHARFLIECLDSIAAQTFQNFQLIVTDDCSKDGSAQLIEDWLRVHRPDALFIRHSVNVGLCKTLNEALAKSQGEFISMIATDDAWEPAKIECQLAVATQSGEQVAVIYSDASRMDEDGARLEKNFIDSHAPDCTRPSGAVFAELANRNFIPAMSTLIRRQALVNVGMYDERLAYEDYDMWLRLASKYEFVYVPATVARYRIVATSMVRTIFTNPSPHYMYTVYLICMKWLPGPLLKASQRVAWKNRLWDAAYGLYAVNDRRASACLWQAAWYGRKPYAALLALTNAMGISRDRARRLVGRS